MLLDLLKGFTWTETLQPHLPPQLGGVCDALEEEGVLCHTLDAKSVVDGPHTCSRQA